VTREREAGGPPYSGGDAEAEWLVVRSAAVAAQRSELDEAVGLRPTAGKTDPHVLPLSEVSLLNVRGGREEATEFPRARGVRRNSEGPGKPAPR